MRLRLDMRRVCRARMFLGTAMLAHGIAAVAATSSNPLVLDTQRGIHDGKGGLILQTAPLSSEPIVEPAGMRMPAGQSANTSIPLFVAPYIDVPGTQPIGRPRPTPRPQLQP